MESWFRKGNARRYNRIDMPIRYYIVPRSAIRDRDIYATGTNYFPKVVLNKIAENKAKTVNSLTKIQEQKQLVNAIFVEIINTTEVFGRCCEKISAGVNPKLDHTLWRQVMESMKGFQMAQKLKTSSPKTYQYMALLQEKLMAHFKPLLYSINNSTSEQYVLEGRIRQAFKIDGLLKAFDDPKFDKIPLIQAILNLANFMDLHLEVYRNINDDNYIRQFPEEWETRKANVSASGLAVELPIRFEIYTKLDVLIFNDTHNRILEFEGSVVDIRENSELGIERIAINFEFPDSTCQAILQQEIQKQEVKDCMPLALFG